LNAKLLEIAQTKVAMYDAYASELEQTAADEIYLQHHPAHSAPGQYECSPPETTA
jgi:hypothetical protein